MSFPSVLSPWYVVVRQRYELLPVKITIGGKTVDYFPHEDEYFTNEDDGGTVFQTDPKRAAIFATVRTASIVAGAEGATVRVLFDKDSAKEFGRD